MASTFTYTGVVYCAIQTASVSRYPNASIHWLADTQMSRACNTSPIVAKQCIKCYCTVLYCTVLYCTVLYCTVLYCNVLYCTVLHQILSYYSARADDAGKVTFRKVLTLFILLFIFAVTLIARRQRRMILRAEVRSKVRHLTFLTMQVVTYVAII